MNREIAVYCWEFSSCPRKYSGYLFIYVIYIGQYYINIITIMPMMSQEKFTKQFLAYARRIVSNLTCISDTYMWIIIFHGKYWIY